MLAYYLEWHMRQRLTPMLFDDTDKEAAEAQRRSVVAQAQRSKQTTGVTPDGLPVHSFRSLLADPATVARNTIITAITPRWCVNRPMVEKYLASLSCCVWTIRRLERSGLSQYDSRALYAHAGEHPCPTNSTRLAVTRYRRRSTK